jgi:hypothetical protein
VEYENNSDCNFSIAITPNESEEPAFANAELSEIPAVANAKMCEEPAVANAEMSEIPAVATKCEVPTSENDDGKPLTLAAMLQSEEQPPLPVRNLPLQNHRYTTRPTNRPTDSVAKKYLTHPEIIELIFRAIEKGNSMITESNNMVDLVQIIWDKLDGVKIGFNPKMLSDSNNFWYQKGFLKSPICSKKIGDKLRELGCQILIVHNFNNTEHIRKVFVGYNMEEHDNSHFVEF